MADKDRFFDMMESREREVVPPSDLVFVRADVGDGVVILPAARFKRIKREVTLRDKASGAIVTGKELETGIVVHTGHNRVTEFDPAQYEEVDADPAKRAEADAKKSAPEEQKKKGDK